MISKILFFAALVALVAVLACGGDDKAEAPADTTVPQSTAASVASPTSTPGPAPTAAPEPTAVPRTNRGTGSDSHSGSDGDASTGAHGDASTGAHGRSRGARANAGQRCDRSPPLGRPNRNRD